ncbi:ATP-grasp domain-containing protein [Saliphagus sp. LR7]|uniref:carboxylate--amine ligase n=1 Tax=Saliphagus sp. LR7 TaxID=2282654 RepID=UPI000DF7ECF3|nr:ATP-grasp domain-containing protein [Saliphagus sp. LR7]
MIERSQTAVITASRYPHGYASVRSLGKRGVGTIAAVDDPGLGVTASRYCDKVVSIPPTTDLPAYKDALVTLAARPEVRTIVPHRPQDPYVLSRYGDEFTEHIDLVVPPLSTLRAVHDRKRLAEVAKTAGVPIPETRLLSEVESWSDDCIVKSRYNLLTGTYVEGFEAGESRIAKSITHVPAGETPPVETLTEELHHDPIVQEYVSGTEYLFGALYEHGEPLGTFQHRQIRGDSYTGSGGVYRESVFDPKLEATGRAILDELEWHGLACIEYVKDEETGAFSLVEINPRMWQSLACSVRAGADFPYWYWLVSTGNARRIENEYDTSVRTHYLYGELEHLVSVARKESPFVERPSLRRRALEIGASCIGVPNFDFVHQDDPRPIARQAKTEVERAVSRRL